MTNNNGSFGSSVGGNLFHWSLECLHDNVNSNLLVHVFGVFLDGFQFRRAVQQGLASSGNNAFFDGGAGSIQSINDAVFLFSDFHLGGTSYTNDGNTPGELGQSFLELLTLVVGFRRFDGVLDEFASFFDSFTVAGSSQNNGVVLVDFDLLASSQLFGSGAFQLHASFFGNDGSACEESQILHCSLAVVTESRSLYSTNLDSGSELVDHQGRQGFAFDVLGNNQQRALALDDGFQDGNKLLQTADLLFDQQNVGIFQNAFLCLGIGNEVGANESAFEFHTFDNFQFVVEGFAVLDGDDTFLSDSFHGIGNQTSNLHVRVGRNSSNLGDLFLAGNGATNFCEGFDHRVDGHVDSSSQVLWIQTSGDGLASLGINSTGQDGGGGGPVSCNIVRLGSNAFDELGTHVLKGILEIDGLRNRNTILGNFWCSVWLGDDCISSLRSESDLNGIGQCVHSHEHAIAAVDAELNFLAHKTKCTCIVALARDGSKASLQSCSKHGIR
mmetsp:Transcript_6046/g.17198  ORF Transcript_6046/g.17198 Transcript_6046/m.17198 type:complete len:498 (+) Transcript_6046:442-1935(+)